MVSFRPSPNSNAAFSRQENPIWDMIRIDRLFTLKIDFLSTSALKISIRHSVVSCIRFQFLNKSKAAGLSSSDSEILGICRLNLFLFSLNTRVLGLERGILPRRILKTSDFFKRVRFLTLIHSLRLANR